MGRTGWLWLALGVGLVLVLRPLARGALERATTGRLVVRGKPLRVVQAVASPGML